MRHSVFLDVDDLQDIGNLEGYVRATGVMLFFLSKRYFTSRNCQREIKTSLDEEKPCEMQPLEPNRYTTRCKQERSHAQLLIWRPVHSFLCCTG